MLDLKPYGGFIEHTIRPLITEFNKLGFKFSEKTLSKLIELHLLSKLIDFALTLITVSLVCYTTYLIAK